jgi:hypothetical protein
MGDVPECLRNIHADPLGVRHADLERYGESEYRSVCPRDDCEGVLLVARDQETFDLLADDRCTRCGQPVKYLDIARMRRELG